MLITIYAACAFYGMTPVLLPYNRPHPEIYQLLEATSADALICSAGSLPLDDIATQCKQIRLLTWVVEKTSRHMDWTGVPASAKGRLSVSVWHDVVDNGKATASTDLPSNADGAKPTDLVVVWSPVTPGAKSEIVTFTQKNMVAAVGAAISALPLRQRFSATDLVMPIDSFTHNYVICQTFAALFTHASLAINSVATPGVDFNLATRAVNPTVVIASAETLSALHAMSTSASSSILQKLGNYNSSRALSAGRMPTEGGSFGNLALILTSERIGSGSPVLTSSMLSDLRLYTRARICYALTAATVAGAVAQTNIFDYRRDAGTKHGHFGLPLSSVEVKLVGKSEADVSGQEPEGEIVVMGPAVSGSEAKLGIKGRFRHDGVLEYA